MRENTLTKMLIVIISILSAAGVAGYFFLWSRLHPAGRPGLAWADGNVQSAEKTEQPGLAWADGNVQSAEKTELWKLFNGTVESLYAKKPDPAIRQILQGVRKDPSNGYWYYLIAAAHVQKGQTGQAVKDVKKGNQQAMCYLYVTQTGVASAPMIVPPTALLHHLARDLVAQTSPLGTEAGVETILAVRTMGEKIARQEPKGALPVLLCTQIRSIANQELVRFYEQAGLSQQAQAARDQEARDQQWRDSVKAPFLELTAELSRDSA
jgi:hypothetical protein